MLYAGEEFCVIGIRLCVARSECDLLNGMSACPVLILCVGLASDFVLLNWKVTLLTQQVVVLCRVMWGSPLGKPLCTFIICHDTLTTCNAQSSSSLCMYMCINVTPAFHALWRILQLQSLLISLL